MPPITGGIFFIDFSNISLVLTYACFLLNVATPDSRLLTPDSRLLTPDSRLPTPDSRLPTPDSRLLTPDS